MSQPQPIPPTNVRIQLDEDRVIPVECVYRGRNADGFHIWEAVAPVAVTDTPMAYLLVEHLPAATSIVIALEGTE